jgi:hypothetical protein
MLKVHFVHTTEYWILYTLKLEGVNRKSHRQPTVVRPVKRVAR